MVSWQERLGRLADFRQKVSLERGAMEYISTLPEEQPLLVACSGGADSVFLVMAMLQSDIGISRRLHLVHFNHGMRVEADADERFVSELADGLGLAFHAGHPEQALQADEGALRQARYAWMTDLYHRLNSGGLLLGHHADDVIESLLMAVLTGSGPAGLAAPLPVKRFSDGHVRLRPLLSVKREDIIECLRTAEIPWREDSSNQETTYTRNWLRLECIPRLRRRLPQDIYSGTQRTRERMQECLQNIADQVADLGMDFSNPLELDVRCLAGKSPALIRHALMSWWLRHFPKKIVGKGALETLLEPIESGQWGGPFAMGAGIITGIEKPGILKLYQGAPPATSAWTTGVHWNWRSGPLYLPPGTCLQAEIRMWDAVSESPYVGADPGKDAWVRGTASVLHVRQWQPGDRYQPLGAPGRRKLQDMFVDAKLSDEQKHTLPVLLESDGTLIWVPGFPPAEQFRLTRGDKSALKLTYHHQLAGLI